MRSGYLPANKDPELCRYICRYVITSHLACDFCLSTTHVSYAVEALTFRRPCDRQQILRIIKFCGKIGHHGQTIIHPAAGVALPAPVRGPALRSSPRPPHAQRTRDTQKDRFLVELRDRPFSRPEPRSIRSPTPTFLNMATNFFSVYRVHTTSRASVSSLLIYRLMGLRRGIRALHVRATRLADAACRADAARKRGEERRDRVCVGFKVGDVLCYASPMLFEPESREHHDFSK